MSRVGVEVESTDEVAATTLASPTKGSRARPRTR
jgi:hypothetical protein